MQTQPEQIDPSEMELMANEVTQQLATNLRQPRCLQELLGGARAKVEEVWRPQTQDPGVHFVPFLGRACKNVTLQLQKQLDHFGIKKEEPRLK